MKRYITEIERRLRKLSSAEMVLLIVIVFGIAPIALYTLIRFVREFSKSPWVLVVMGLFLLYIILMMIGQHKNRDTDGFW